MCVISPYSIQEEVLIMISALVVLLHCGWGVDGSLSNTLAQYVEAIEDIQLHAHAAGTPEKKESEYIFEFLRILGDAFGDEVDEKIKFEHYKMVRGKCVWAN